MTMGRKERWRRNGVERQEVKEVEEEHKNQEEEEEEKEEEEEEERGFDR